jgi:Ser/Thr protein kinase RdoA (MazF antagonist)
MSDLQYNLQFEKLCNYLALGEIVSEPEALTGGLLHRMYSVETTQGKYAIKALNPQIMLRPTAMKRFINSELIANLAANYIPALPAKKFKGNSLQEIDGQFYIVFGWLEGTSLKPNEINIYHCENIGAILADIHKTNFSELGIEKDCPKEAKIIDWNYYLDEGLKSKAVWANQLAENIDKIYAWNTQANKAAILLYEDRVISHRDLDPKNVLWNQGNPIIIDWEAAGYVNPMQELIETAIYWSQAEADYIDKERFLALIKGYKLRYGELYSNWKIVLSSGFCNKFSWLEYNLKRSLMIECTDEKEQEIGINQVMLSLRNINQYAAMISEIEQWLNGVYE